MNKNAAAELFESAMMHGQQGNLPAAVTQLHQYLLHYPDDARAWNNRGLYLLQLGHPFDAVLNIDRALALEPNTAEYYNNRGVARADLQLWEPSLADYDQALKLKPSFGEALVNTGNIHKAQGRKQPALESYRAAVAHNPDYVDGHLNLSFMELELGNFEVGWKEFEWRWKSNQLVPRGLPFPEWDGSKSNSPEEGLLLYTEQGHGDAIHFMRYAALAKQRWGGKVYLEVRQPLARLAATMRDIDGVVCFGEAIPADVTRCAPVMSCPRILSTTVDSIPGSVPYVFPSRERIASCRKLVEKLPPGLRVGACWAGMNRVNQPVCVAINQRRSTELAQWAPLAAVTGVSWVSLQKGPPAEQVRAPPAGMTIADCMDDMDDFYDTAALIAGLDLVISVDTAVAHVAGALGVPTWLLSRYDGCWRWLGNRRDSPWYPSMTIFAQPEPGDWRSVMHEAQIELCRLVQGGELQAAE